MAKGVRLTWITQEQKEQKVIDETKISLAKKVPKEALDKIQQWYPKKRCYADDIVMYSGAVYKVLKLVEEEKETIPSKSKFYKRISEKVLSKKEIQALIYLEDRANFPLDIPKLQKELTKVLDKYPVRKVEIKPVPTVNTHYIITIRCYIEEGYLIHHHAKRISNAVRRHKIRHTGLWGRLESDFRIEADCGPFGHWCDIKIGFSNSYRY